MEMDLKEFIYRVEEWKKETGKKDKDFCKEVGIHVNTLVNWKKGHAEPQAEKMKRLCEVLGIKEVDLTPRSFYTAKDNENKLYYRAQQLQRYAKAKGLNEEFYKQIIKEPYFLREFPFSDTNGRFVRLCCPREYARDKEYNAELDALPLVKYEFQDDYGNIIMLTEDDIDFLIQLDKKRERVIRDEMYLAKRRIDEEKTRDLITAIASWHLEDGHEMNADELYRVLARTDVTERFLTGETIHNRFMEYKRTHNVQMKSHEEIMFQGIEDRYPPMSEEEERAWRVHYEAAGMTNEEIEEELQWKEKLRQFAIEYERCVYRPDKGRRDE